MGMDRKRSYTRRALGSAARQGWLVKRTLGGAESAEREEEEDGLFTCARGALLRRRLDGLDARTEGARLGIGLAGACCCAAALDAGYRTTVSGAMVAGMLSAGPGLGEPRGGWTLATPSACSRGKGLEPRRRALARECSRAGGLEQVGRWHGATGNARAARMRRPSAGRCGARVWEGERGRQGHAGWVSEHGRRALGHGEARARPWGMARGGARQARPREGLRVGWFPFYFFYFIPIHNYTQERAPN
jgi:hypothetical protein